MRMRRLILGFAGRTYHIVGNLMHWFILCLMEKLKKLFKNTSFIYIASIFLNVHEDNVQIVHEPLCINFSDTFNPLHTGDSQTRTLPNSEDSDENFAYHCISSASTLFAKT